MLKYKFKKGDKLDTACTTVTHNSWTTQCIKYIFFIIDYLCCFTHLAFAYFINVKSNSRQKNLTERSTNQYFFNFFCIIMQQNLNAFSTSIFISIIQEFEGFKNYVRNW